MLFVPAWPVLAQAQQPNPGDMVRVAIQNELADKPNGLLLGWKEHKLKGKKTEFSQAVQTPSGTVSRVMLVDGKPLNAEERRLEEKRVRAMIDPEQMRRKRKDEQEDDEHTRHMLGSIPDAFDFTYLDSSPAPNGHKIARLRFIARPGFAPPSHESMVFTGMQGEMLLDEDAHRIVKIDGVLFKDVNFGWGILGKLYKGGRFMVQMTQVTATHWDTARTVLHFDGKILLLKPLHINEDDFCWDYHPVPTMTTAQALEFLQRQEPAQNAQLGGAGLGIAKSKY